MRIAYLCSDVGIPVFGTKGASVHVREVVKALASLGHTVEVFSPAIDEIDRAAAGTFRELRLSGLAAEVAQRVAEDVPLPDHLANEWGRLLYNEHVQRPLVDAFEALRPDFIYERYALFGYAGLELARRLELPLLLEVNAPLVEEQEKYRTLVLKSTAEVIERRVLSSADAMFVVSAALAAHARALGAEDGRVHVLPNAVDADAFSPAVLGTAVRERYGLQDKRVVAFVGSLKAWHDVDCAVEAVRLLQAKDARYHLLVVGEGPRLADLQAAGLPFVTCTGGVEHAAVPAHLAVADVVAVPYSPEGDLYFSPLKLFEGMAMAKPVAGARIGQVAEVVVDGVSGRLYTPGDAADLAAKIEEIFALPDAGAALGAAAREQVLARHTWRANAAWICEVAGVMLGSPAGRV